MILSILRQEYLELIIKLAPELSKTHRYCTAKLIQLFNWITKQGRVPIRIMRREIYEKLLGEHGKDAIAKGINILENLDLLRLEINSRDLEAGGNGENGQNKTYRYYFNGGLLDSLLQKNVFGKVSAPKKNSRRSTEKSNWRGDCSPSYIDPCKEPFLDPPPPTPQEEAGFEKKHGPEDGVDEGKVSQNLSSSQAAEECCCSTQLEAVEISAEVSSSQAPLNKNEEIGIEDRPSARSTHQGLVDLKEVIPPAAPPDTLLQKQQYTLLQNNRTHC